MKILFVINNYYVNGNGMSTSARRSVGRLRAAGHEVRVLSGRGDRPELMRETGARYAESVSAYDMDNCVEHLSSMFAFAASGKSA